MSTTVTFFGHIKHALDIAFQRIKRERMRRELLGLSDRTLDDVGFSRELLKQGQKAWPWRKPDESLGTLRLPASRLELYTYRNTKPALHSSSGAGIEQAIRLNQPGIDTELAA